MPDPASAWTPVPEPTTDAGSAWTPVPETAPVKAVTLGDLTANPREAMGRIGQILKQDVTDPTNWAVLAAAYFGPKVLDSPVWGHLKDAPSTAGNMATAVGKSMVRRIGIDPEAMELQSERLATQATRMRLQAAQSRTRQAQMQTEMNRPDIIPLPPELLASLPKLPETPAANLPAPATAVPPPTEAPIPQSWRPYAGQSELAPVQPAQPPGYTSAGNKQPSRVAVPPVVKPASSPASAVNQAMQDLGLRFPARFMDAAIKRVKNGEAAVDVVRSYAEAQ